MYLSCFVMRIERIYPVYIYREVNITVQVEPKLLSLASFGVSSCPG